MVEVYSPSMNRSGIDLRKSLMAFDHQIRQSDMAISLSRHTTWRLMEVDRYISEMTVGTAYIKTYFMGTLYRQLGTWTCNLVTWDLIIW